MPSIKTNRNRDGEIISYRVRACMGRDPVTYRQILRSCTLPRPQGLTPKAEEKEIRRQADQWEQNQRDAYTKGLAPDRDRQSLGEFIRKHWWPEHVENGKHTPNGIQTYKYLSGIILAYFGERTRLAELTLERMMQFLRWLRVERNYSGETQTKVLRTLNSVLDYARRAGYLEENPADLLKAYEKPVVPPPKIDFLTPQEAREFLSALEKYAPLIWQCYFNLLIFAGLRRGEALALQWRDYDRENRTLTVSKSVSPTFQKDIRQFVKSTKTGREREVPVADTLAELLEQLKQETFSRYGETLDSPLDEWFIFCRDGKPTEPRFYTDPTTILKRFEKAHGLREVSCHDLRHTCATLILESNGDLKQIQAILGHRNAALTMQYYAGISKQRTHDAVKNIDTLLKKADCELSQSEAEDG